MMFKMEEKIEEINRKSEEVKQLNNEQSKALKEALYRAPTMSSHKKSQKTIDPISSLSKSPLKEVKFQDGTRTITHSAYVSMDIGSKSDEQEGYGKYMPNETYGNEIDMPNKQPDLLLDQNDIQLDFNGSRPLKLKADLKKSPNKQLTSLDEFISQPTDKNVEESDDSKGVSYEKWNHQTDLVMSEDESFTVDDKIQIISARSNTGNGPRYKNDKRLYPDSGDDEKKFQPT